MLDALPYCAIGQQTLEVMDQEFPWLVVRGWDFLQRLLCWEEAVPGDIEGGEQLIVAFMLGNCVGRHDQKHG